jgi:AcrR family transcriptional regulator
MRSEPVPYAPAVPGRPHDVEPAVRLSCWGHDLLPPNGNGGPRADPRVHRTHQHVLEHARRLLVERGPAGVAFSVLAQEAQVSRQTLYRYWNGPEALVADLVRRRTEVDLPEPTDLRAALTDFLRGLRTVLEDPAVDVAYGILIAAARHQPAAACVLREVLADRRASLNDRLADLRPPLDEDEFARLVGPLATAALFGRRPIDDRLIDRVVDSLC